MKKVDKYILRAFIGPFVAILLMVIFVLMMQFLWLYIDELIGKGLSISIILEFLGWGCATLLPMALPLATLLSCIMTLGNLGENNELLALKSSGISLQRLLIPIGVVCIAVSIGAFYVSNNLIPLAYNKIYTLRDDIAKTKEEINIPVGTFYNGIDGYILRINDKDEDTQMMHDVMVYNHTSKKGNVSITLADSAEMKFSNDEKYLYFTMYDGVNYEETNTKKYRDTTLTLQKIRFKRQEMLIPLENYSFQKSDTSRFDNQAKSMNLSQLRHHKDSIGEITRQGRKDDIATLCNTRAFKYGKQLAVDTTSRMAEMYDFPIENVGKWKDIDVKVRALEQAKFNAAELKGTLTTIHRTRYFHTQTYKLIRIEIFKKFALSMACLIFFLIGAPIGALIRKGGLGTPAIISVLLFVLYWVIDISGTKMSRDGTFEPFHGVFLSTYILLPLGLYLTWQAIHDSPIFHVEHIKNQYRKIKAKFMGIFKKTRIVYMGTPEFAIGPLEELIKNGNKIVGIVTVPDKASGRGLKINESAVKKYATEHNIPVLQPVSLKDPEFISALKKWKADIFVVVAFRLLPREVWELPKMGTFNLHAALLPQYRGAAPINWAIINGEKTTGVTTFMIDDGVDTGNIMFRYDCKIGPDETAGEIHDKLMELGSKLVVNTVEAIEENNYEMRIQRSFIQGSEILKGAPKLTRELCHIDWRCKTRYVYNLIRGLSPYPAAFTELSKDGKNTQMKIFKAVKVEGDAYIDMLKENGLEHAAAGTVLSDGRNYLAIATNDGAISVTELQLAGKKRMNVKDFLIGFREPTTYTTTIGTSADITGKR